MKILKNNILLVFLLLYMVSCTKETNYEQETCTPKKVVLHAQIENKNRTAKNIFNEGDSIGIYIVDYVNGSPGILGSLSNSMNIIYSLEGNNTWHAVDAEDEIYIGNNMADLYSYYPYDKEIGGTQNKMNLTAYPFSVDTNQNSSDKNDFLWAKYSGLSNNNNELNVIFKHALTKININLSFNGMASDVTNSSFKIHNLQTSSTINLRTGEVTPAGDINIIKPSEKTANENEVLYEAIIIPQTLKAGTPLFSIELNDGTILIYELENKLEFLPQKSYVFNLIVGTISRKNSVVLKNIEIKDF